MDSEVLIKKLASGEGYGVGEARSNLPTLIKRSADGPQIIRSNNVPVAAIVGIDELREIMAKAEAYELMTLAEDAEISNKLTIARLLDFLKQGAEHGAARELRNRTI